MRRLLYQQETFLLPRSQRLCRKRKLKQPFGGLELKTINRFSKLQSLVVSGLLLWGLCPFCGIAASGRAPKRALPLSLCPFRKRLCRSKVERGFTERGKAPTTTTERGKAPTQPTTLCPKSLCRNNNNYSIKEEVYTAKVFINAIIYLGMVVRSCSNKKKLLQNFRVVNFIIRFKHKDLLFQYYSTHFLPWCFIIVLSPLRLCLLLTLILCIYIGSSYIYNFAKKLLLVGTKIYYTHNLYLDKLPKKMQLLPDIIEFDENPKYKFYFGFKSYKYGPRPTGDIQTTWFRSFFLISLCFYSVYWLSLSWFYVLAFSKLNHLKFKLPTIISGFFEPISQKVIILNLWLMLFCIIAVYIFGQLIVRLTKEDLDLWAPLNRIEHRYNDRYNKKLNS